MIDDKLRTAGAEMTNRKEWSVDRLAGQRLMVGFDGTEFNGQLEYLIGQLKVGGIILFSRNIDNPEQVAGLCRSAQAFARSCGLPPILIAIDQEGGQVARLKEPFTQFPGNPNMKCEADAVHFARVTARELGEIGINMNMAPVLDIAPTGFQSIMAGRSFGHDPERVSRLGCMVIRHLQKYGIMAVAKHFPGIGRTVLDSHFELPTLEADLSSLQQLELIPFKAAIESRVSGFMLSHIHYPGIDPVWPASLSRIIAHDLLRTKMGYRGVVMTDDLDMGAIEKHYDLRTSVNQVLAAEIDLMLICHWSEKITEAYEQIVDAVSKDASSLEMCIRSVERISAIKEAYLRDGPQAAGLTGQS